MVRPAVFGLLLLGMNSAWALTAQIDRKDMVIGEALTLSVSGKTAELEQLDLSPLKRDFEIFARTLSRGDAQSSLQLMLYPLRSGQLSIPALGDGKERSRSLAITVATGSELMPETRFSFYAEPARPYVRQPTRLTLEICDDGSLDWKRPALPLSGMAQHRPLGEEQIEIERDGARCTAHRYHWAVLPTQAGEIRFELPMLEAGKFGQRFRLPPPAATFSAKAVPGWLPLNVPVGRPTIETEPLPVESPIERPLAWRFTVDGGYSVDGLKALLALQLQPYEIWKAYPPTVEALAAEDRNSPLTRLAVTLYALPEASGPLTMPELALPYFDPASARLQQLSLPRQQLQVYNPLWRKLGKATSALLGLILIAAATELLRREIEWRRARRKALADIASASSPAELAAGLRAFQLRPDPRVASTLRRWSNKLQQQSRSNEGLNKLVATVEACHYGGLPIDLPGLKQQASAAISRLRPRRRWK